VLVPIGPMDPAVGGSILLGYVARLSVVPHVVMGMDRCRRFVQPAVRRVVQLAEP